MAAAALAALEHTMPLLPSVHSLTRQTADQIRDLGYTISLPVQTNMIVLDLYADDIPPAAFVEYGKLHGVTVFPTGRLVFHHQNSPESAAKLVTALGDLMADKRAGKPLTDGKVHGTFYGM